MGYKFNPFTNNFDLINDASSVPEAPVDGKTYGRKDAAWAEVTGGGAVDSVNGQTGVVVLDAADVGALPDTTDIPTALADLSDDATHRLVTDTEKSTWNGKQDALGYTPVQSNSAITGATKTKITYDAKGLVTSGADATTADIADSLNKRYVTDANLTVIGNTSGTNTGDETTSTIKTKLGAATTSTDGYLTSTDWNTFNGKQAAGAYLTSVTADSPLTGSGTAASHLSIPAASASANGYLSSTDWSTFNGKQAALGYTPVNKAGDTLTGNLDFAKYKAVAMCCDNGTSFPASPATGQWFYRTDIKTLFIYEAAWKATESFGAVTLYVDGTLGTDAVGQGYASGANAVKTIQYAIDLIPALNGGNVTVNVAAGTYAENVTINGKGFTGNYSITLLGAYTTTVASQSVTSGTSTTVVKTGAGWTTDVYSKYLLKCTKTGQADRYGIIKSNTSDTLTIAGNWTAVDSTWNFEICESAVTITGTANNVVTVNGGQRFVYITAINIVPSTTTWIALLVNHHGSFVYYTNGRIVNASARPVSAAQGPQVFFFAAYIECSSNGTNFAGAAINLNSGAVGYIQGNSWVRNVHASANAVLYFDRTATAYIASCTISGLSSANKSNFGIVTEAASIAYFQGAVYVENSVVGTVSRLGGSAAYALSLATYTDCTYTYNDDRLAGVVVALTTNTTLLTSHNVVVASGSGTTITFPTAVGVSGKQYTIKRVDASNAITVATTSSQTIDGSTTYSLSANYKYITVVSDGANWIIVANN